MTRKGRKPLRCGCRRVRIGQVTRANGRKTALYRFDRCDKHRAQLLLEMLKIGFVPSQDGAAFIRE